MTASVQRFVEQRAGCNECHGQEPHWFGVNAAAVAARHHQLAGHLTWAVTVAESHFSWGDWGDLQETEA